MSYNIRNGKGIDNVQDFQRIIDAVNRAKVDVVAVQEVDSVTTRNPKNILKIIGDATGGVLQVYKAKVWRGTTHTSYVATPPPLPEEGSVRDQDHDAFLHHITPFNAILQSGNNPFNVS